MVTRRSLLKQGAYAALALRAAPSLVRVASAQTVPAGFDYYISPAGSDSNPGTQSQPWAITAINTHRADYAGKRVGLLDGTYNVHALCQAEGVTWSKPALAVNGGPSADSPTVIAAVNPRKAILTGADPTTGAYPTNGCGLIGQGYMQTQNRGNVTIDGLYITRSWMYGIMFYTPVGQQMEGGTSGFTVRNCEIYDIGGVLNANVGGVMLYFCTGALVSNNQIHSVQPPNLYNSNPGNAAGIFSFNSHSNIYEYNTIYDCNTGVYDKNAHNGNHTYRFNFIETAGLTPYSPLKDCSGGEAGDTVTVHNNIFVNAGGVWDGSNGTNMPSHQSLVFYNNTCICGSANRTIDNAFFYAARGNTLSPPAMVTFYNNIIQCAGATGYAGLVLFCAGTIALSNYNCFSTTTGGKILALNPESKPKGSTPQLYSLAEWRSATGMDSRSSVVAATFTSPSDRTPDGFRLLSGSQGLGLGRVGGIASGAAADVGAWGGGATQIGANFGPAPKATQLSVS